MDEWCVSLVSVVFLIDNGKVCHRHNHITQVCVYKKSKGFQYSLPSVGPGADPGVQAVSPVVT